MNTTSQHDELRAAAARAAAVAPPVSDAVRDEVRAIFRRAAESRRADVVDIHAA